MTSLHESVQVESSVSKSAKNLSLIIKDSVQQSDNLSLDNQVSPLKVFHIKRFLKSFIFIYFSGESWQSTELNRQSWGNTSELVNRGPWQSVCYCSGKKHEFLVHLINIEPLVHCQNNWRSWIRSRQNWKGANGRKEQWDWLHDTIFKSYFMQDKTCYTAHKGR